MHVLSLPPAFVLSQDQTLKLKSLILAIISRTHQMGADLWSRLNRREHLHTCRTSLNRSGMVNSSLETCPPKSRLNSLSGIHGNSAAHVSLSSLFNCQRTDTRSCQTNRTRTSPAVTAGTLKPNPARCRLLIHSDPFVNPLFQGNRPFKLAPPGLNLQAFSGS